LPFESKKGSDKVEIIGLDDTPEIRGVSFICIQLCEKNHQSLWINDVFACFMRLVLLGLSDLIDDFFRKVEYK
jgi:hypothetical protein